MSLLNTSSNLYLFDDLLINETVNGVANNTCIRCAVVGNGGILNGSRIGHVIDSHDYVFRWVLDVESFLKFNQFQQNLLRKKHYP